MCNTAVHNYKRKRCNDYNITMVKSLLTLQKQLFFEGLRLFNDLPIDIKNSRMLRFFLKNLIICIKIESL